MNETQARSDTGSRAGLELMPSLFVGHGSPMNAIEDNRWSRGFEQLGARLPRPHAIVAVSAHWYVPGTFAMSNANPRTIHDFGGFPRALHEVEYPAAGKPELADQLVALLRDAPAALDDAWGLDHGTWSVLRRMYPNADVPVVQLSIDRRRPPREHFELARGLAGLREQGVLIMGSGNLTHNLRDAFGRMQQGSDETPDWAGRFDAKVAAILEQRDTSALLSLWPDSEDGRRAHPTPDHWLPLIYAYAASQAGEGIAYANEGFDAGSLSMRSVVFG